MQLGISMIMLYENVVRGKLQLSKVADTVREEFTQTILYCTLTHLLCYCYVRYVKT